MNINTVEMILCAIVGFCLGYFVLAPQIRKFLHKKRDS